ncbi:MAG: hypothetical protein JWR50_547 [Mucilaginibacter sp.]|nr:hypothetical protein [Mucilaginibacter sp.]
MAKVCVQLAKAQNEILEAWEWYEDKQQGLGDRFKQEIANKIKLILSNPFHYPRKGKYIEVNIDHFPYLIVFDYDENEDVVFIISVFHTSRYPGKKY